MWTEYFDLMSMFDVMVEDLIVGCMAREGFEYRPLPLAQWTGWDQVVATRPIRALSVHEAAENGYLRRDDTEHEPFDLFEGPDEEREAFYEALSGDETVALDNGMVVNTGGCMGCGVSDSLIEMARFENPILMAGLRGGLACWSGCSRSVAGVLS